MTGCACSPAGVFNHPTPDICEGSARLNVDRLTADDLDHIRDRIGRVCDDWRRTVGPVAASDLDVLVRVGAHAIGCTLDDLRPAEIGRIAEIAGRTWAEVYQ